MAVTFIQMDFAGQSSVLPRRGVMVTTDSLETITTAGYLNQRQNSLGNNFFPSDFIFVNYDAPNGNTIGGSVGLFTLNFVNGVITMVIPETDVPAFVQDVTPGTSAPDKALSLDNNSLIDGTAWSQIKNAALATTLQITSVTTVSTTPASGSCAAQFQLKTFGGANIAYIAPISFYVSDASGNIASAVSSVATLTNGVTVEVVNGQIMLGTSTAAGLLGITLTGTAATYHVTFVLPNGTKVISSALVVNA